MCMFTISQEICILLCYNGKKTEVIMNTDWMEAAALAALAAVWAVFCTRSQDAKYARSLRYQWFYYVGYMGWSLWLLSWAASLSGFSFFAGGNMWGATLVILPAVAWHMGECWRIEAAIDRNEESEKKDRKGRLLKRVSTALLLMNLVLLWHTGMQQ